MRIVVYTKHGLFEGKEEPFGSESELHELLVKTISKGEGLSFETESGSVHIPNEIVKDSIFLVEK